MEQSDFSKVISILKVAYPYYFKNLDKESSTAFLRLYYENLKKYCYEVVVKAINTIIKTDEYMPSLAEVIRECDRENKLYYRNALEEMYRAKYFKTDEEYGKAVMWLLENKPIIPGWLKGDVDKYIETNKIKRIETEVNENE